MKEMLLDRVRLRLLCVDCGVNTHAVHEYYMVQHELWRVHGAGRRMLCVGCLELRVGRQLVAADFLPCLLNSLPGALRSARLQARLHGRKG